MRTMTIEHRTVWLTLAAVALVFAPSQTRAEPQRPLLVAVEMVPGACCEPVEVRRAVGDELKTRVMAPSSARSAVVPDTLIVSLDRTRIVVSMRAGSDRWVSRGIDAPADPNAQLRAIAWLAGNVARDQVSRLLDAPGRAPVPLPEPVTAPALPVAPIASIDVVPPAEPQSSVVAAANEEASRGSGWQVSAFGGPAYYPMDDSHSILLLDWQVELQRQRRSPGSIFGFALQVGPATHLLGIAGFLGSQWRRGRWVLEATGGGGIEVGKTMQGTVTTVDSSRTGTYSTVQSAMQIGPALYARGTLTAGIRLGSSAELLARVGLHMTTMGLMHSFLAGTVGLRLDLP
jgi:hypothetical protein